MNWKGIRKDSNWGYDYAKGLFYCYWRKGEPVRQFFFTKRTLVRWMSGSWTQRVGIALAEGLCNLGVPSTYPSVVIHRTASEFGFQAFFANVLANSLDSFIVVRVFMHVLYRFRPVICYFVSFTQTLCKFGSLPEIPGRWVSSCYLFPKRRVCILG